MALINIGDIGCDECDKIDGDYFLTTFNDGAQLKWDTKKKRFMCPRGHEETIDEALRTFGEESLYLIVCNLLNKISDLAEQ